MFIRDLNISLIAGRSHWSLAGKDSDRRGVHAADQGQAGNEVPWKAKVRGDPAEAMEERRIWSRRPLTHWTRLGSLTSSCSSWATTSWWFVLCFQFSSSWLCHLCIIVVLCCVIGAIDSFVVFLTRSCHSCCRSSCIYFDYGWGRIWHLAILRLFNALLINRGWFF